MNTTNNKIHAELFCTDIQNKNTERIFEKLFETSIEELLSDYDEYDEIDEEPIEIEDKGVMIGFLPETSKEPAHIEYIDLDIKSNPGNMEYLSVTLPVSFDVQIETALSWYKFTKNIFPALLPAFLLLRQVACRGAEESRARRGLRPETKRRNPVKGCGACRQDGGSEEPRHIFGPALGCGLQRAGDDLRRDFGLDEDRDVARARSAGQRHPCSVRVERNPVRGASPRGVVAVPAAERGFVVGIRAVQMDVFGLVEPLVDVERTGLAEREVDVGGLERTPRNQMPAADDVAVALGFGRILGRIAAPGQRERRGEADQ